MVIKLNVICDWFSSTGYANHARGLITELNKNPELDLSISCNKPTNWIREVDDTELKMMNKNPENSDVLLMIGMPQFWKFYLNENKKFIGFIVWEGDRIPKYWGKIIIDNRVNQIWVPSLHTKEAIIKTITEEFKDINISEKIKIVPHGVDLNKFYPKPELKERKLTFIVDKGWRGAESLDRGGIQYIIRAFNEEFKVDENVQLLIKINPAYNPFLNLEEEIMKLGVVKNKNILICYESVPFERLNEIYNKGHVFVSTSMAEAFNLGCVQALACGLPVLTTDYGGQTDYINKDNGWLLTKGKSIEVDWDVMYEGVKWKVPDIQEIKNKLRFIYEHPEEVKTKIINSIETAKKYTWNKSAEIAYSNIKNLF